MIGMVANKWQPFRDNLCLWKCLAYHEQKSMNDITTKAKEKLQTFTAAKASENYCNDGKDGDDGENEGDSEGIKLEELALVETVFNIFMYLYELTPKSLQNECVAMLRRRSAMQSNDKVYLNLYKEKTFQLHCRH